MKYPTRIDAALALAIRFLIGLGLAGMAVCFGWSVKLLLEACK